METKKYYYYDSYKMQHQALVTAIDSANNTVELDSTIFHPQGGGQPSDKGTIAGIPVTKVMDLPDGGVQHHLATPATFAVGTTVVLAVDPEARLMYAKLHSAGHALAHIGERAFPGLKAVQGHHFPLQARVEFTFTDSMPPPAEFMEKVMAGLKALVDESVKVAITFDDHNRRQITMGDFPTTPCGGTHVKSLSEIDGVTLRSVKRDKDRLRVGYGFGSF